MDRILIVDDHPLFRDALKLSLTQSTGPHALQAAGQIEFSSSLEEALSFLKQNAEVDLVLLDLHLPGNDGFLGLLEVRKLYPAIAVLVISGNDDPSIIAKARACGAAGFISKSLAAESILHAVQSVLQGDEYWPDIDLSPDSELEDIARRINELTDQQLRVLRHLQDGRLNKQIAYDLDISEATVKAHVTAIFRKLNVLNRTQAVILANKLHVDPPISA
ncbi:response regulator transcription factor [Reinekea blandensis]|uniref:Two-component system, response regulator n=1 Tax=Reinekea blandensis MED297 TaxID=314283 RepID=A4BAF0_9GAMM|nr:response regulator transcription factor [Reinekea blandensis]EAR10906.1 two-component system, response regulator [Reinekea sp. MED297] [Reinekea blandensis MED297]